MTNYLQRGSSNFLTKALVIEEESKVEEKKKKEEVEEEMKQPKFSPTDSPKSADNDHFRRMRPTSWSPPPTDTTTNNKTRQQANRHSTTNVCKITVTPSNEDVVVPTPMIVHRLKIPSSTTITTTSLRGTHGSTSIMINGEQQQSLKNETTTDNKVTISVTSGNNNNRNKNTICSPTVISINNNDNNVASENKIQTTSDQKQTLVILDNYKSNIVIGGDVQQQKDIKVQVKVVFF